MLNSIKRCFEGARLARENFVLRRELAELGAEVDGLVGHSVAIQHLRGLIKRIAPMPTTVLLQGESGTGKEVTARALHQMSARGARPFVPVNCGAIAAELIESELFGHVKGAFTGATGSRNGLFYYAHGGTLFLDEIAELPLAMQTKLLRVLEERKVRPVGSEKEVPVDVRIITATNRELAGEVMAGRFRQDLYYRLAVVDIAIPPLRSRREDVGELAVHFMGLLSTQLGVAPLPLTCEVLDRMAAYAWPGNVRELKNFLERSLILGFFPIEALVSASDVAGDEVPVSDEASLLLSLADVEKKHVLRVLGAAGGNKSEAARRLGVSRKTLERKCLEWGECGASGTPGI
jgi:DNA-binding NtrC family response regulator